MENLEKLINFHVKCLNLMAGSFEQAQEDRKNALYLMNTLKRELRKVDRSFQSLIEQINQMIAELEVMAKLEKQKLADRAGDTV